MIDGKEIARRIEARIRKYPHRTNSEIADGVRFRSIRVSSAAEVQRIRGTMLKKPAEPTTPSSGLGHEEALKCYDSPTRLADALALFLASMKEGLLYEEAEVKRACGVTASDGLAWDELTCGPVCAEVTGTTEDGKQLWGTVADMVWAADNITAFRRSDDATTA